MKQKKPRKINKKKRSGPLPLYPMQWYIEVNKSLGDRQKTDLGITY